MSPIPPLVRQRGQGVFVRKIDRLAVADPLNATMQEVDLALTLVAGGATVMLPCSRALIAAEIAPPHLQDVPPVSDRFAGHRDHPPATQSTSWYSWMLRGRCQATCTCPDPGSGQTLVMASARQAVAGTAWQWRPSSGFSQ